MSVTNSPNMNLPIPVVGVEPGPDYATDINNSLSIVDAHDHTSGNGVSITPSAININADLSFNSNNATLLRSTRYQSQVSPISLSTDLNCLSVSGVDLYYRDGAGNIVRITQSGGVAGSPGSIANLTSPASASYVAINETFVWQSDANVAANLDFRSAILRNASVSSFGLTLQAPTLSGDITQTLPQVPGATSFVTMNSAGSMGTTVAIAQGITTSMIADQAITTAKIADANVTLAKMAADSVGTSQLVTASVTYAKLAANNNASSAGSGSFTTSSTSAVDVTGVTTAIAVTGTRPVIINITANNAGGGMTLQANTNVAACTITLLRDGVVIGAQQAQFNTIGATFGFPLGFVVLDTSPSAGSHTYKLQASVNTITTVLGLNNIYINAIEL